MPAPLSDGARWLADAQVHFLEGHFEQALRGYSRVLQLEPAYEAAWAGQVRMLIELGEFQEARIWADKALEKHPNQAELLAAKAVALARSGALAEALALSDAAIEQRGDCPYIWLARGDVLLARKEKRADHCFTRALSAAPGEWLWFWLASRIHSYYRRFAAALKLVSESLALAPGRSVVWSQMGRCQLALGLADAARTSFQQARQLDPGCEDVASGLRDLECLGWWARLLARFRGRLGGA